MENKEKGLLRLVAVTAAAILLCAGLLSAVLLHSQASSLQAVEVSPTPALPVQFTQILAENTSPLTGLPLPDSAPEGRRITAISVDGLTNGGPLYGLGEAAVVIEAVIDMHYPRMMALYEDYETIPRVGPLRSARRQTFELVQPFQPILVSNGSNTWLNELLEEYEYGEWHLTYGDFLYREGEHPTQSTFTDGERLAQYIGHQGVDGERAYNSGFFDFRAYGDERQLLGELAQEVWIPLRTWEEGEGEYASRFLLNGAGRYEWHRYDADKQMQPVPDANTGEVVAFDNLLVLLAPMALMEDEEYSMVVDFYGGVGFYCYNGGCEVVRWQKGGPLNGLRLFYEDFETPYQINPGTTYLALADIADVLELYIGVTRE